MEYNIGHIFIITVPIITLISYILFENLSIFVTVGGSLFMIFSLYIYNNYDRKERLNIIRDRETLYFNLSDDQLFTVKISNEEPLSEIITRAIIDEMVTIQDMVSQIDFINFRDDGLNRELNLMIQNP